MVRLQDDILLIYNSLTDFSETTLLAPIKLPIRVRYSESSNSLSFEQRGLKVSIPVLNYYCKNLRFLDTYLVPEDYDYLMETLSRIIESGVLLHDRVCLAPVKYGFEVYDTSPQTLLLKEGPQLIGEAKFISGNSWLFKKIIKFKYEGI